MAVMLEKLYDALRAGDVPEEKAREAAKEVAEFKNELGYCRLTRQGFCFC
jgi:hypothetical protein